MVDGRPKRPTGEGSDTHNGPMVAQPPAQTPFADVDQLPAPFIAQVLGALEGMAAHPEIQRVRRAARDALDPRPGLRVLDAGCGVGEVARGLAADVAPSGEVVALDRSTVTVARARGQHDGSAVRYVTGDVEALDFADDSFDAVRCERVLQHLADPDAAVAELVRVTRPGGRICLIDTDWESLTIDGLPRDLIATVREHLYNHLIPHHRDAGRTLRRRLVRAGVADVSATPVTCTFTDVESAAVVLPMFNPQAMAELGILPEALHAMWTAAIESAQARGELLAALTIWVAAGTVR